jgi:methyltransferase
MPDGPDAMGEGGWLVLFIAVQRVAELVYARRNTQRLLAVGAMEVGASHYPLIVAVHALWLAALWIGGHDRPVFMGWLIVFIALQAARVWVLIALGWRWTTRVMVLPGATPIARGPYRIMRHPNYAVVAAEIAVVPLALGLPWIAFVFSIANAGVLWLRVRVENAALDEASARKAD